MGNRPQRIPEELDFVPEENIVKRLSSHYKQLRVLGSGVTARVVAATWLEPRERVAIKQMNRKDPSNQKLFRRECMILQKISHPNILQYKNCYIDRKRFYIITHLCTGGHLLRRIQQLDRFTEEMAADAMKQIVDAVAYLHANDLAHRDLKPANMVFEDTTFSRVVLIDLGSAAELEDGEMYEDWVGTPAFMAPELLKPRTKAEVKASDVWAIGVTCFQLLTGEYPFWGSTLEEIFKEISQKPLSFKSVKISEQAIDFINLLLQRHIENRHTIEQAVDHPWLKAHGEEFNRPLSHSPSEQELESKSKELEIEFRRQVTTGQISFSIQHVMESMELKSNTLEDVTVTESPPSAYRLKSSVPFVLGLESFGIHVDLEDVKEDEVLEDVEMLNVVEPGLHRKRSQWPGEIGEDDLLRQVFEALDEDGNGQVLLKDLQLAMEDFLHRSIAFEEADTFLEEIRDDNDGTIQFEEFANGMKALAAKAVIEITSFSVEII